MMSERVVMFSGGIGSWAAAKRVAERHGTEGLTLLFADTKTEDEDTYRFMRESAANVGGELVEIADGRTIWEVFRDRKFLGNHRVDPCSELLKRKPSSGFSVTAPVPVARWTCSTSAAVAASLGRKGEPRSPASPSGCSRGEAVKPRTVWKFTGDGRTGIDAHYGIDPILRHVGCDPATGLPAVWIEHTPTAAPINVSSFDVIGTGWDVPPLTAFVGTAICGAFVWHVYQRLAVGESLARIESAPSMEQEP